MRTLVADGVNILRHVNIGSQDHDIDAETTPLQNPRDYQFDIDTAEVAEVLRRGRVVASLLLDLIAISLKDNPDLSNFSGSAG